MTVHWVLRDPLFWVLVGLIVTAGGFAYEYWAVLSPPLSWVSRQIPIPPIGWL